MSRRLLLLNLALLALAGVLVWALRSDWFSAQNKEKAVLGQKIEPKKILAPPSPPPVKPVSAGEYVDVAGKMLFAKDRNPTVVIEPPPPPPAKPETPMPALPRYFGQMAIGEPVALLSLAGAAQRGYHAGDTIGDFTLVGFDRDNIEFEWQGKPVKRKIEELRAKADAPPATAANPSGGAAASSAPFANATSSASSIGIGSVPRAASLGGAAGASDPGKPASPTGDDVFGPAQPDGSHACLPADTSAPGTVHSGFIKNVTASIVGILCNWEKLK